MNRNERYREQNKRIVAWFENRTGLKDVTLSQHMKRIDELLDRLKQLKALYPEVEE